MGGMGREKRREKIQKYLGEREKMKKQRQIFSFFFLFFFFFRSL